MKMEILLEPTSNKLMVGNLCDSIRIKLVTTGKKRWCDSIRIKLVPGYELMIDDEFLKCLTLSICHKTTLASDTSSDFQIDFSISIGETVTHWFTLIVLFYTSAGNPVKEILLKLNLPDHRILKDGGEVLKSKNFKEVSVTLITKKDATLKFFKSTNQERYEHVGPKVIGSQDGKVNKMVKQDYAWLMISRCSRSHSRQDKEQAQDLKSMITTSNHKLMIEVKDYELKTKVEA
ncbi:hypothetical protein Tco_0194770 [Tanacetum coccineum]